MTKPPRPDNETSRLAALIEAHLLDTAPEPEYDDIVELASQICDAPISLVSLLDQDRQWFKAKIGLEESSTDRDIAFCSYAILDHDPLVVQDARLDPRFANNPLVTGDASIRFYAGVPIETARGFRLGTLCVLDRQPRSLRDDQLFALRVLAKNVSRLVDLRIAQHRSNQLLEEVGDHATRLEQINYATTRLLSVIAHDVRGPLTSIASLLDVPDVNQLTGPDLPWLLGEIRTQADTGRTLLDQILAWARTVMQGGPTIRTDVRMGPIVDDVVGIFESASHGKGITFERIVDDGPIATDPNLIRFVIHTLVSNAVKFSEGAPITVTVSLSENEMAIHVKDRGRGIPDRIKERMFDWSRRSNTPGTKKERGAGLGLLLVRDFLDMVHGSIDVQSQEGHGTTVSVFMPRYLTEDQL